MMINSDEIRGSRDVTLYISTTLDHFLEPFDHDLGRCPLANPMRQAGVEFHRATPAILAKLKALVERAERLGVATPVLRTRWQNIVALS